ncbi:MAG: biopolymer transporter ExbD [Burkholderiaceae bacterium]
MRIEIGDDEQPEISLIALIDCIFFLLMFFMVATSFKHQSDAQPHKALAITLPDSAVSFERKTAAPHTLLIGADVKGGIYWDNDPVSQETLRERLHAEAQRDPEVSVRVAADGRVPYQAVIHLLDLCQFEGLTHVSLQARAGREADVK